MHICGHHTATASEHVSKLGIYVHFYEKHPCDASKWALLDYPASRQPALPLMSRTLLESVCRDFPLISKGCHGDLFVAWLYNSEKELISKLPVHSSTLTFKRQESAAGQ